MYNTSLTEQSAALHSRRISSLELTQLYLDRIQRFNPVLNAYITLDEEGALAQARAADERLAKGDAPMLCGIPIAHKDLLCTKGLRTSCASRMLDNFISPYDATLVQQLAAAGTVTLGKTNMDEFAMGSSNETSWYGPVKNPWDLTRIPGGSSGGSAAALAAGLCAAATGTDTGGSIRQPAAHCGITSLKPTYGRVSRYGMIAFASSLDQAGPMTRTAEDAALLLQTMAGFDERDSTSSQTPVPDYRAALGQSLKGLKLGLPKEFFTQELDAGIAQALEQAIEQYRRMGLEVREISLPHNHLSVPVYYVVAPAECSSNMARFDGVRYGHRCDNPRDLEDLYKRSRQEGFGTEVKRRILIGTYALSAGYYDAYYLKAQQIRHIIADDFKQAFNQVDFILAPTTPTTAFELGSKSQTPLAMYLSDIYTIAVNLAGVPAMSLPLPQVQGLPAGMQLIGNYFDEARLLALGHGLQQCTDWHLARPSDQLLGA
jgi:aspartyl-tRNA(Asn)/glutamyl-tRNA(Gln) amidotransferase subunit A